MSRETSFEEFCCKGKQKNEVRSGKRYRVREHFDFISFLRGNAGCLKANVKVGVGERGDCWSNITEQLREDRISCTSGGAGLWKEQL